MTGEKRKDVVGTKAVPGPDPPERSLLIVDDDRPFLNRLAKAMQRRGFDVTTATTAEEAVAAAERCPPRFAVVDLRLEDGYGLDIVPALRERRSDMRIIVLTGYGNIASAVSAIKIGTVDYLTKPANADDVEAALLAIGQPKPPPPTVPMSADRVRWEHIQRVFELCDRNISETARRLNIHRRTLQRILAKHSPR